MEASKIEYFELDTPKLCELRQVLQDGLKSYFQEVAVDLTECPDFNQMPAKIPVSGLHGKPAIADVGGVHNLIPRVNLKSHYNLSTVVKSVYNDEHADFPVTVLGPGGGAYYNLGYCCEFMGSASFEKNDDGLKMRDCACRYAYVDEETGEGRWKEQKDDDRFGLMGNFFLCQNESGKILKVHVKKRIGKENYTEAIRAVLLARYGTKQPVSMGGVFYINSGVAKLHIMPKHWPEEPSTDHSVNHEWLKYYNIRKNPLVCLSVFHSHDPGYNLRMEHTHCYNLDTIDEAGHYHHDTTPESVEYEGYFNVAERVYRLDGPPRK